MDKKKIAILMLNIGDISGGGGTERQFADVFDFYPQKKNHQYNLFFITTSKDLSTLQSIGKLKSKENIILIKNGLTPIDRWIIQPIYVLWFCFRKKIDLIHFPLVGRTCLSLAYLLKRFPKRNRPKIAINMVDCTIAHEYFSINPPDTTKQLAVYKAYFKMMKLDSIFSWYQLFKERFSNNTIQSQPLIVSAKYCFTDINRFKPLKQKENIIVFAARMTTIKQPLFFLAGVRIALKYSRNLFKNWAFIMYGKGELEKDVKDYISKHNMEDKVILTSSGDMSKEFAISKVFVSTQMYENFTSLSMLEAMACGNAIISRDVGQTDFFVKNEKNGLLLAEDTPKGLADSLIKYVSCPESHFSMQQKSIEIATKDHCLNNFLNDIENFWSATFKIDCI